MNVFFDQALVPIEGVPAACENIVSQGFEIVSIFSTGMVAGRGGVLGSNGSAQASPVMGVVAKIMSIERKRIMPPEAPLVV